MTSVEMSSHLNRKLRSLHTALKVLEATKQLELLYPEEPNHPRQAYRTNTGTPQFDGGNSAV